MTRTARAAFPRAIIKDRSESKTGLDKSLRKNGAGHHNWGSLAHEDALVSAALEDGELELRVEESGSDTTGSQTDSLEEKKPEIIRSSSVLTEEERATAKKFRKNALKAEFPDLTAIARTSSGLSA